MSRRSRATEATTADWRRSTLCAAARFSTFTLNDVWMGPQTRGPRGYSLDRSPHCAAEAGVPFAFVEQTVRSWVGDLTYVVRQGKQGRPYVWAWYDEPRPQLR